MCIYAWDFRRQCCGHCPRHRLRLRQVMLCPGAVRPTAKGSAGVRRAGAIPRAPSPPPLHPPPAKLQLTAYPHGDPLFPLPARHQFTDSCGYPLFPWPPAQQHQLPLPRQQQLTAALHGSPLHPPPAQQQAASYRSKSRRRTGKRHGRHGWHGWHPIPTSVRIVNESHGAES